MPLGSSLFTCLVTSSQRKLSHVRAAHCGSAPSLLSPFPLPCCGCGTVLGASCTLPCPQMWSSCRELERVERASLPQCTLCSVPCLSWQGGLTHSCLLQATSTKEDTKMGLWWGHLSRSEWWCRHNLFSGRSLFYQQDNHVGWWLIPQARRPNLPVLSNLTWSY